MAKHWRIVFIAVGVLACACYKPTAGPAAVESEPKTIDAQYLITGFKDAGLPISDVVVYTEENNRLLGRPGQYIEKVDWADTRVRQFDKSEPNGGTLEIFKSVEDLERRKRYLESGFPIGPPLVEYRYVFKNALVRIRQDLTPKQAADYEAALNRLSK